MGESPNDDERGPSVDEHFAPEMPVISIRDTSDVRGESIIVSAHTTGIVTGDEVKVWTEGDYDGELVVEVDFGAGTVILVPIDDLQRLPLPSA
jgi:ssDNA-binding replication factor A large subunit